MRSFIMGAIALLLLTALVYSLLVKLSEALFGSHRSYEFFTADGQRLVIRHTFMLRRKIYVSDGASPLPLKHDRHGSYFLLRACSASRAEDKIDRLYQGGCAA